LLVFAIPIAIAHRDARGAFARAPTLENVRKRSTSRGRAVGEATRRVGRAGDGARGRIGELAHSPGRANRGARGAVSTRSRRVAIERARKKRDRER